MRLFTSSVLVILAVILFVGCARRSQERSVESALNAESSNQASVSESLRTEAPENMPEELALPNATVELSMEVQDGYQVSYATTQSVVDIQAFYRARAGWSVVAEFASGDTQSISIERPDQRVLVTITPKGSGAQVLVTGSFIKEAD